ncbi:hypothetical protein RclHR1_10420006 [Rhizophagus clarus]|uniref:MYND-type domain-containing protein n=1 Tax=Rhizophagus clarus TaxID=94130 RepID=A0A2Z6QFU8_9GLOM|nr:hypothetical protein RclHR1_10420006 [Rhizophagus clarus]GES99066.1 hypothetical protein RCL_jg9191.t1 [Rhizophagus clarus]
MKCSVCENPTTKRCIRCHTTYYCGSSCQKKDYSNHVLDCPSKYADILVKNVFDNVIPTNWAVRYEYGFRNCLDPIDESMLLGLYIGLIKIIGCNSSRLHSWWKSGNLPFHIKNAYDKSGYTSEYYKWFLKNEHVLQGLRKYEGTKSDNDLVNKLYEIAKPYLSEHDQKVPIETLPESKRIVFIFYTTMLSGRIPRIEELNWIEFGFCSCKFDDDYLGEMEERRLGDLYRELIIQKGCKVDEFHDAYISGSLLDLLKKKCNSNDCDWLSERKIEIKKHNQPAKSVYDLKQYVLGESVSLQRSVTEDYGFKNCRTEVEKENLKNIYRKLIKSPKFEPRDLYEACLEGKTYHYVRSILPNETLNANIFKNLYIF